MNVQELVKLMPLVVICMARGMGMVLFIPVLTGHPVNSRLVKSAIVLAISIPVICYYWEQKEFLTISMFPFTLLLAKETFIGICIGFSAGIPFWAIEIAGFLIDTMRGATMAQIFNVMLKSQTSLFGALFSLVISVLFLSLGGMQILLQALYLSYKTLPILPFNIHMTSRLIDFFSEDIHMIFLLALAFALPAMLIMLLTDIVLGLINVSAKELNVFSLSMPIKSVLGLFLVIITINYSIPYYIQHFKKSETLIHRVMEGLK